MTEKHEKTRISRAVIAVMRKAEINPAKLKSKRIFNQVIISVAVVILVLDLWAISQGLVTTDPGKKFAAFVALGAGLLLLVGLISNYALVTSALSYERLQVLVERAEKDEIIKEEGDLIAAIRDALRQLEEPSRSNFVGALKRAKPLQEHPALEEYIDDALITSS